MNAYWPHTLAGDINISMKKRCFKSNKCRQLTGYDTRKGKNILFSGYLDLEIAAIFLLLVQDHEPFLLNRYFLKHKELVPQCTGLCG